MTGLSRLFPKSRRFNAYNLEYLPEDAVHEVDSVVGAFMMVRREAIQQAGLLDESYFMYGEDLDWAKRIKDAGWEVWYNGDGCDHPCEGSRQPGQYQVSHRLLRGHVDLLSQALPAGTGWWVDKLIRIGIAGKGGVDIGWRLWRYL